jgi:hypothetical protein
MNRSRFQELLDIRGSDLAIWPKDERLDAEELIAHDRGAAQLLAHANWLDAAIERGLTNRPEYRLDLAASRIIAQLSGDLPSQGGLFEQTTRYLSRLWTNQYPLWPRVAVVSFAAALGIVVGFAGAKMQESQQRTVIAAEDSEADLTAVLLDSDPPAGPS